MGSTGPKSRSMRLRQSGRVPLLFGRAARHVLIAPVARPRPRGCPDGLGDVLGAHEVGALLVDHAALVVRDVVVLQQLLAGIEVVLLDPALRPLDLARQHAALDGLARLHAAPGS